MHFQQDESRFFGLVHSHGKRVATHGDETDLDTSKELEDAIGDLENALNVPKSSGYETKVKKELSAKSVAADYDAAKLEWGLDSKWVDPQGGKCELCGHVPIIYQFKIKNKHNHNTLVIGSECILNYVVIEGFSAEDLKKYLTRLRKRLLAGRFDEVDKELLDVWDKQDAVFASLKQMVSKDPDLNVLDFYNRLSKFSRGIAGYTIKDVYKNYIQQVGILARVMEKTYGEVRLGKVPDRIERKRKVDGEEVTDTKKLELYVQFEAMLKVLFKFGSPTEAYNAITEDVKEHLRSVGDTINTKRTKVIAGVNSVFDGYKATLGNRPRLKDYVDSWCDLVEAKVTESYSNYQAALTDIDGILAGKVYIPYTPSDDPVSYIFQLRNLWYSRARGEQQLYSIVTGTNSFVYRENTWRIPSDSPLKQVLTIPSDDLKSAILTCLDRDEIPLTALQGLYITSADVLVTTEWVAQYSKLVERLVADSPAVRKYVDSVAKAEAEARAKADAEEADRLAKLAEAAAAQQKAEKEFKDLLEDAAGHTDPNKPFEKQFVDELSTRMKGTEKRYNTVADLSTRQLSWLKSIATRRVVPQQAPPDAAAAQQAQPVTPGGTTETFAAFLDGCKTSMHPGREDGFIEDMRRKYKVWSALSPRQQKWLQDIYTRNGRKMPDQVQ